MVSFYFSQSIGKEKEKIFFALDLQRISGNMAAKVTQFYYFCFFPAVLSKALCIFR